ncbi:MAG: hypothetical protein LBD52_08465 [Prevotellaceae bacterium]|jgi:hypothetical protein|nr:hypothetical protein [Prevotellaceae bacterium]
MTKQISIIIITGFFFLLSLSALRAQAQQPVNPMQVESWILNAGMGFGQIYDVDGSLPSGFAFKLALQRGFWEAGPGVIALGLETGMVFNSTTIGAYTARFTKFNIAPRAGWHCGWDVPGLDTYAGVAMGIGFLSQTDVDTRLRFHGSAYIGGSYFFNEHFGVNLETGFGTTFIQVGVAYKF